MCVFVYLCLSVVFVNRTEVMSLDLEVIGLDRDTIGYISVCVCLCACVHVDTKSTRLRCTCSTLEPSHVDEVMSLEFNPQ